MCIRCNVNVKSTSIDALFRISSTYQLVPAGTDIQRVVVDVFII